MTSSHCNFLILICLKFNFSPPTIGATFPLRSKIPATLPAHSFLENSSGTASIFLEDRLPRLFFPNTKLPQHNCTLSCFDSHFIPATFMDTPSSVNPSGGFSPEKVPPLVLKPPCLISSFTDSKASLAAATETSPDMQSST